MCRILHIPHSFLLPSLLFTIQSTIVAKGIYQEVKRVFVTAFPRRVAHVVHVKLSYWHRIIASPWAIGLTCTRGQVVFKRDNRNIRNSIHSLLRTRSNSRAPRGRLSSNCRRPSHRLAAGEEVLAGTAWEAGPEAGHNIDLEGDHTGLAGDRRRDWAVEDNHHHHRRRRHSILGQT